MPRAKSPSSIPWPNRLTGWKADEAFGQPVQSVFRVINEQTGQAWRNPCRVLREGRTVELANHAALVTKDGRTVPIEDSAAPILDAAGQVIGVVLVFHDVTEKRRAEELMLESEQRFRSFVEATTQVVWTTNPRGEVDMVVPSWQAYTCQSAEQARGFGWMEPFAQRTAAGWPKRGNVRPKQVGSTKSNTSCASTMGRGGTSWHAACPSEALTARFESTWASASTSQSANERRRNS